MKQEIRISKKSAHKGEDGHKVVSVRMKDRYADYELDSRHTYSVHANQQSLILYNLHNMPSFYSSSVTSSSDKERR